MTADDVLDELDLEDNYDNFDEPVMPDSDDEFTDDNLEDDDNVSDDEQVTLLPQCSQQPSLLTGPPT